MAGTMGDVGGTLGAGTLVTLLFLCVMGLNQVEVHTHSIGTDGEGQSRSLGGQLRPTNPEGMHTALRVDGVWHDDPNAHERVNMSMRSGFCVAIHGILKLLGARGAPLPPPAANAPASEPTLLVARAVTC